MQFVFVITHLGAGGNVLCKNLALHKLISWIPRNVYSHPTDWLMSKSLDKYSTTFIDELVYNDSFRNPSLYNCSKFIYLVREAEPSLKSCNLRYYTFRLRRICEMAKNTPGALLLTSEDVISGRFVDVITDYLDLKNKVPYRIKLEEELSYVDTEIVKLGQISYDRHLAYLKKLPLSFVM